MSACTATECVVETAPGMYLCKACVKELAGLLGEAEALLALAGHAVSKQGTNRNAGGSTAAVSSAPLNLDAVRWRDNLARALAVYGLDDASVDPVRRAWAAARSGNAGHTLADLDYKVWRLRRIVDLPVERRRLAACGVDGCHGSYLYTDGDKEATCSNRDCRATMDIRQYRVWQLSTARAKPLPLAKLCQALTAGGIRVNPNTAKSWVRRGQLDSAGVDGKGTALYTANQVIPLVGAP